jgi:hypothetical protein
VFSTTFLGHQGWLFQSDKACLLVDPLLCEDFGAAHKLDYRVWPPRVLAPEAFPPIDALVLSHEHDDHFDIPSLAKLDRAIPVYLSSRSSTAAGSILRTMGFQVHPLSPGVAVRFADLELTPFCGDHVNVNCGDEWDTLPFVVRHTDGHGSMFSMVDITLTQGHVEWVASKVMKPGLVSWTNNAMDWSHMADYLRERVEGTQQCFVNMGVGHKLLSSVWGTPAAMLMCAGGFYFPGDKAWLNQRVFCVDNDAVCKQIGNVYKKERFFAALPGQTFRMKGNKLQAVDESVPFLMTTPRDQWPSRAKAEVAVPDYAPATTRAIDDAGVDELRHRLDELAGSMVGSTLFRSLFSLLDAELGGRKPTFVIVARREPGEPVALEYDPSACGFRAGTTDRAAYLAGFECWASDLLAVLRGELGPIGLTFGRARLWNALPKRFNFDIFGELHRVSHPLRRPADYLKIYERLWQANTSVQAVFRGRH